MIAFKRTKYLGINVNKGVKDLHSGNYKLLLKEIKEDLNKWKDTQNSRIGSVNIEMKILPTSQTAL